MRLKLHSRPVRQRRRRAFAAPFALLSLLILPAPGNGGIRGYPEINVNRGKTPAGHPYMSGGISVDEQLAMERLGTPFNLRLLFFRRTGTLVAPRFVMIGTNDGRKIETVVPRAPWIYIRLPPGGYTILARFQSQIVLLRDIYVREGGRTTFHLRGD